MREEGVGERDGMKGGEREGGMWEGERIGGKRGCVEGWGCGRGKGDVRDCRRDSGEFGARVE